jgi:hypothetical protein
LDGAEFTIFLSNEKEGAGHGGFGRAYIATTKVVDKVFLQGLGFSRSKTIDMAAFKFGVWFQVNGMIPWLVFGEALGSAFAKHGGVFTKLSRDKVLQGRLWSISGKGGRVCGLCTDVRWFEVLVQIMLESEPWGGIGGVQGKVRGGGAGFQRANVHCRFD